MQGQQMSYLQARCAALLYNLVQPDLPAIRLVGCLKHCNLSLFQASSYDRIRSGHCARTGWPFRQES